MSEDLGKEFKVERIITPEGEFSVEEAIARQPPKKRARLLAGIRAAERERNEERKWIAGRLRDTFNIPSIVYKYVPIDLVGEDKFPISLRATQPLALNDVMEANVTTMKNDRRMDRAAWGANLSADFERVGFPLPREELEKRLNLYGDPRISTAIQDYLAEHLGVVSLSADPLIETMWAHYAGKSGFVVGYDTATLREFGIELRRVLYLELAPFYEPFKDDKVRLHFIDEKRRRQKIEQGDTSPGIPVLHDSPALVKLSRDWKTLSGLLFIKGKAWEYEKEVRLTVSLEKTRDIDKKDPAGWPIRVIDAPPEAVREVYVGFNTPRDAIGEMRRLIGDDGSCLLKHTSSHAYRMEVTSTSPL